MGTLFLSLLQFCSWIQFIYCFPNEAIPLSACEDMIPQHNNSSQPQSANPYSISPTFHTYLPNRKLAVVLAGSRIFRGYYVQARQTDDNNVLGMFNVSTNNDGAAVSRLHTCPSNSEIPSENTISHNGRWRNSFSDSLVIDWTPPYYEGDVYFRGTFAQSYSVFWIGTESFVLKSLAAINFTECCRFENGISPEITSFCSMIESQGFLVNSDALELISDFIDDNESLGVFQAFRCLHWSTSSTSSSRTGINGCCATNNVPETCLRFCDAELFTSTNGFSDFNSSFQSCMDANEAVAFCQFRDYRCEPSSSECSTYSSCVSNNGNPFCQCNPGFTGNGSICDDLDECLMNLCDSFSICTNTLGSFYCTCGSGLTGDGLTCSDIDECAEVSTNGCSGNSVCTNVEGSYTCTCFPGFTGDGFTCSDVRECDDPTTCSPEAFCVNQVGSFSCACNAGFSGDGIICEDINECNDLTSSGCSLNATCFNVIGSFSCSCNEGFTGDGFICQGVHTSSNMNIPPTMNPSDINFPPDAIVYMIEITFASAVPSTDRSGLFEQIRIQLLEPAFFDLPNYHSIRRVEEITSFDQFTVRYDVIFVAVRVGTGYQYLLLDAISSAINSEAANVNDVIVVNDFTSYSIGLPIEASYLEINDECQPIDVCDFLYQNQPTICVTIGSTTFSCVCTFNNTGVRCEDVPAPSIQPFAIRYLITTTILVDNPSQQQIAYLNNALEQDLLVPAFAEIFGYNDVRFVDFAFGSLLVTSQAEFLVPNLNNLNSIPTTSLLQRNLETRSGIVGDTLTSAPLATPTSFSRNFDIVHETLNGLCSSGVECPSPPTGYTSQCVEIGLNDFVCVCVSTIDNMEVNCNSIGGGNTESLSTGAIVGIAVGGVAVITVAVVVVCCCLKRRKRKKPKYGRTSDGYLDTRDISTVRRNTTPGSEPVYMEIGSEQYGQYIYLDKPYSVSEEVEKRSSTKGSGLTSTDGYETPVLMKKPSLPKNHPTQGTAHNVYEKKLTGNSVAEARARNIMVAVESADGYLMPVTDKNEDKQLPREKEDKQAEPKEDTTKDDSISQSNSIEERSDAIELEVLKKNATQEAKDLDKTVEA